MGELGLRQFGLRSEELGGVGDTGVRGVWSGEGGVRELGLGWSGP